MVDQNQKDKNETIEAKEKAFEASIKSLTEQIESKQAIAQRNIIIYVMIAVIAGVVFGLFF